MKKLLLLAMLLPMLALSQNDGSKLLNMSEITVKPGHESQFIAGVKMWKECYLEKKGTDKFNVWRRVQGEGIMYVLTGLMDNWAEMDKEDSAGKECRMKVLELIMPHVEKVNYNIARTMPEVSRTSPLEGTKLVWVSFFRVENGVAFNEVIKEISALLRSVEGTPRGSWYSFMGGGPGSPDYMISTPYKGYADLDITRDGIWKVYENKHGKKKTDEIRAKIRASLENSWSYLYSLNEELSN
ncbi:MAG: hypothetical protein Q8Q51_13655 [Lutibacter sp.]|nr:hypothetical protein [Lutibacter sp.]